VTVTLGTRSVSEVTATVSWGKPEDNGETITGYTVVGTGGFTGGSRETQTTGTSATLAFPCSGTTFCSGGQATVEVTALNRVGESAPGTRTWTVPAQTGSTSTPTDPPPNTPPPTEPPPNNPPTQDPTPTQDPPPPPPPVTVPTAGAVVIASTSAPGGNTAYYRQVVTSPPGDWASHDGTCQVVNTTYSYNVLIPCSGGTVDISVEEGRNNIVVRATARDGSRSVDSAARSVTGPREPQCGPKKCFSSGKIVELTPTGKQVDFGQAGTGLGLLVIAVLLRVTGTGRRSKDDEEGST
jgi:hypothetical protein